MSTWAYCAIKLEEKELLKYSRQLVVSHDRYQIYLHLENLVSWHGREKSGTDKNLRLFVVYKLMRNDFVIFDVLTEMAGTCRRVVIWHEGTNVSEKYNSSIFKSKYV
jgi:hypothetical protein